MNNATNSLKSLSSSISPPVHTTAQDLHCPDSFRDWTPEPVGEIVDLVLHRGLLHDALQRLVWYEVRLRLLRLPRVGPLMTWRGVTAVTPPERWDVTLGDIELL